MTLDASPSVERTEALKDKQQQQQQEEDCLQKKNERKKHPKH